MESVVKDAVETAFINGKYEIDTKDLLMAIKDTKSISTTLKEKINQMRDTINQIDIRSASKVDNKKNLAKNA